MAKDKKGKNLGKGIGQQMMDGEHKEQPEPIEEDFEEGFQKESKKQGLLQRIWAAVTNK